MFQNISMLKTLKLPEVLVFICIQFFKDGKLWSYDRPRRRYECNPVVTRGICNLVLKLHR